MENFHLDNQEHLLKLYSVYAQDEYELIRALQNYLKFFSSLIFAIIGGALFLFDKIDDFMITGLGFIIGGIFVVGISYLGYHAARSNYRRQLESIVKRFKIECILDLDNPQKFSDEKYMINEPIILNRYQKDFAPFKDRTSKDFVNDKLKKGFMSVIIKFYSLTAFLGLILIIFGGYKFFEQIKL